MGLEAINNAYAYAIKKDADTRETVAEETCKTNKWNSVFSGIASLAPAAGSFVGAIIKTVAGATAGGGGGLLDTLS